MLLRFLQFSLVVVSPSFLYRRPSVCYLIPFYFGHQPPHDSVYYKLTNTFICNYSTNSRAYYKITFKTRAGSKCWSK